MGQRSFIDFREALRFNLGQRTDLTAYLGGWVNQAYNDFCTRNRFWSLSLPKYFVFPELLTATITPTVRGVATIAVPSDCVYVRHIWDSTSDAKLDRIRFYNYVKSTGRANATSRPTQWVRDGNSIYLYPTPDAAYTLYVYYRKRPDPMVGDIDTTEIGDEWDEPITMLSTIFTLERLKEFDKAEMWKKEWLDMMGGKIGIYDREDRDMSPYLAPDYVYKSMNRYGL